MTIELRKEGPDGHGSMVSTLPMDIPLHFVKGKLTSGEVTLTDQSDQTDSACTFVPHAICNSSDPIDKGFPTSSELLSEASASSTGCGLCIKRLITLRANGTDTVANELRRY